jgi:DNA-binding NarL/FixJ family response regulator
METQTMLKFTTKIMVIDDHPIVRYGITKLIGQETDMEVCGSYDGSEDLLAIIADQKPNLIVLDISLGNADGITITRSLRRAGNCTPVVILSMHENRIYISRALRAGANGYVMKKQSSEQLISAIREVRQGRLFVGTEDSDELIRSMAPSHPSKSETPLDLLSDRERQVFTQIGQGYTTFEIAANLSIKPKTVETYRCRIKEKLEIDSPQKLSLAAIEWATRQGLTASTVS